jgi:hypothetical protein
MEYFIKRTLFFPMAAAINFFSLTALLIIAGLLQKGSMVADIAIIQGAVVAIFLSLSGNARNLILASSVDDVSTSLFCFRFMIVFPAVMAVFFLLKSTIDIPINLILGLILRKCSEWFAELQLANKEKNGNFMFALRYIQINIFVFLILGLTLAIPSWMEYFNIILYIWAVIPMMFLWSYIREITSLKQFKVNFSEIIPHMGSSTVIGMSTYVFRVLIVILAGKVVAGQVFTAYALGGVISSLYTYAIGPTLMFRNEGNNYNALFGAVFTCCLLGVTLILFTAMWEVNVYPPLFLMTLGFSLIGGGVMLLAQRYRLHLLQINKKDVFIPDALANILLISSIPFAYYLFTETSLTFFYLWSAILNYMFYLVLSYKEQRIKA